jgi:hypothetical protein
MPNRINHGIMPELGKPEAESGYYFVESCEFHKEPSVRF